MMGPTSPRCPTKWVFVHMNSRRLKSYLDAIRLNCNKTSTVVSFTACYATCYLYLDYSRLLGGHIVSFCRLLLLFFTILVGLSKKTSGLRTDVRIDWRLFGQIFLWWLRVLIHGAQFGGAILWLVGIITEGGDLISYPNLCWDMRGEPYILLRPEVRGASLGSRDFIGYRAL